jgi:hypothetical protein
LRRCSNNSLKGFGGFDVVDVGPDDLSLARGQRSVRRGNDVQLAGPGLYHFRHSRVDQNLEPRLLVRGGRSLSTKIEYLKAKKSPSGQRVAYNSALGMSSPS